MVFRGTSNNIQIILGFPFLKNRLQNSIPHSRNNEPDIFHRNNGNQQQHSLLNILHNQLPISGRTDGDIPQPDPDNIRQKDRLADLQLLLDSLLPEQSVPIHHHFDPHQPTIK